MYIWSIGVSTLKVDLDVLVWTIAKQGRVADISRELRFYVPVCTEKIIEIPSSSMMPTIKLILVGLMKRSNAINVLFTFMYLWLTM